MSALRVLASWRIWGAIFGVAAALAVIYVAYLAAVASPEENLKDLPIALVNEDRGATLAGEEVNLGDQIVENATAPDPPAAETVRWGGPESREAALQAIGNDEYYGAIVIPADYSERISTLAGPPGIPIAIVVEDEGAELGGQQMRLGEEVASRLTAPDSPAPPFVKWTRPENREAALEGLESGDLYAAIVLPRDYSQRLASLSGPPTGQAPTPAEIELLTSPAVRPSTAGLIENAFTGIVGGVSKATSERTLGGLSQMGAPIPPGAEALISDPVRGRVSEAGVSGEAGPLPQAPQRAEIEVLTNPSAGQAAALPVQNISTGIVQAVSRATSERISGAAGERGAQLTPEVAAVVGDPVRAEVTEAQPVGVNSGNGQSPFFLAFLANLSALMGGAVVFFLGRGAADAVEARTGQRPSRAGLWTVRLILGFAFAASIAGVELLIAFRLIGIEHEASTAQVFLFLALAIAAGVAVTMFLAAALGPAGIGIGAVLTVLLGLVSSGGNAPLEALPGFYQAYADWLPLRYVIDGLRSLLFYNGSLLDAASLEAGWRDALWFLGGDGRFEAAGLEDAVWVLGAYLTGATLLGYVLALIQDFLARRGKSKVQPAKGPVAAQAAR